MPILTEALYPVRKGLNLVRDLRMEARQVSAVFFRPKEVHPRSMEPAALGSRVLARSAEEPVDITHYSLGLG